MIRRAISSKSSVNGNVALTTSPKGFFAMDMVTKRLVPKGGVRKPIWAIMTQMMPKCDYLGYCPETHGCGKRPHVKTVYIKETR